MSLITYVVLDKYGVSVGAYRQTNLYLLRWDTAVSF